MVAFELGGGSVDGSAAGGTSHARVIARPSGTEPKAKFYFDVQDRIGDETLAAAEARARARMKELEDAFVTLAGA
jgi:phosphomannomutase